MPKENDLSELEKPLLTVICGGTIKKRYETIPNIICILFENHLKLTGSFEKIDVQYKDVTNVRIIKNKTFLGKIQQRSLPTIIGGFIGFLISLPFPVFDQSILRESLILLGVMLGNAVISKFNITTSLVISYNENGLNEEINIYPVRLEKIYSILQSKVVQPSN